MYAFVFKTGKKLLEDALAALGFDKDTKNLPAYTIDTLGWGRQGVSRGIDAYGSEHLVDRWHGTPIMAIEPPEDSNKPGVQIRDLGDNVFIMSNSKLEIEVSNGVITRIYDHRVNRDVLPEGAKANQLVLFDDKPLYWQAWDVEVYHLESRKELQATEKSYISHHSPTRASLTTKTMISDKSSITTTITLHHGWSDSNCHSAASYIETTAEVDWHETMKFLKVEFPTNLRSQKATYETQFGLIERPTHYNTSWDMAKFEVCCHKFADLSESNYGVTILNESKYGFATAGSTMRLSLLRAPKAPDAHADMGKHKMRWAIMPHPGPLGAASVRAGYEFNSATHVRGHTDISAVESLLNNSFRLVPDSPADAGLILDTIKRAEDDDDVAPHSALADAQGHTGLKVRKGQSVVLRIFDSLGGHARGTVRFGDVPVKKVWRCNLLEDDEEELDFDKEGVTVSLRAFEVQTLRVELA